MLPLDDWKHFWVWEDYHNLLKPYLSDQSRHFITYLWNGRPFLSQEINVADGIFAWLNSSEVALLNIQLKQLPDEAMEAIEDHDLEDFHSELIDCLEQTSRMKSDLLLLSY